MNNEKKTTEVNNPQRRQMMKAAAWAAPVVAVAASAPLAAASITNPNTRLSVAAGSTIGVTGGNVAGGVIDGAYDGTVSVTNAGTGWSIASLTATYTVSQSGLGGNLSSLDLTLPDGTAIPTDGSTFDYLGDSWTVQTNEAPFSVVLTSSQSIQVPASGSVNVPVPPLKYTGTLAKTTPKNGINFLLSVRVATSNGQDLAGLGGSVFA